SGCCSRNAVRTISVVVRNRLFGQRVASSTRTLPLPSSTRRLVHGSGTHAPSICPDLNVSRVWTFSYGTIDTWPPPSGVVFKPCFLSHDRRATSWVLPSCGEASFLPFRSAALV